MLEKLKGLTHGMGRKIQLFAWAAAAVLAAASLLYAVICIFTEYALWRGLLYFLPRLAVGLVIALVTFIFFTGFGKIVEASELKIDEAEAAKPAAPVQAGLPPENTVPGDDAKAYQGSDAVQCAVCGAGNRPNAKFCVVCGANMSETPGHPEDKAPVPDFPTEDDNDE